MNTLVTCACCGISLEREEAEIALDWQGDECFMCHRCFNEECDCGQDEPMYLYVDEYAYAEQYGVDWRDVEAIGNSEEFFLYGDWLPYAEK